MAVANTIPAPSFVDLEARNEGGLDILGLRLPAQGVGGELLNGVTTITPTVRYLSLRTWLIHRYAHADPRPPDRNRAFVEWAQHAEAAFAMGNLLVGTEGITLTGALGASRRLAEDEDPLLLDPLTVIAAMNLYGGASAQLRLTRSRLPQVPVIGERHGKPLVDLVESSLGGTALGQRLQSSEPLGLASRAELEEFGRAASALDIPEPERQALIRAVLPEAPGPTEERRRLATYGVLLALASSLPDGHRLEEDHLFEQAARLYRTVPVPLHPILDGWLVYATRDSIAVTAEFALQALREELIALDPDGAGMGERELVTRTVTASMPDQERALSEWGLLDREDSLVDLAFNEFTERVAGRTAETGRERGIRRWGGSLTEPALVAATPGMGGGALAMGVLAWVLAERRLGPDLEELDQEVLALLAGHDYDGRFGLMRAVLPRLRTWRERDLPMSSVLAEYAHLVIDQHLRIAWSRMAQDPSRDISVIHRDGDRVVVGASFWAGRAATRLRQAIGWLEQLRLLDGGRTTDEGRAVLACALEALS
jgi:hypothetical protein